MAKMTSDEIRWVADLVDALNAKTTNSSPWLSDVVVNDQDSLAIGTITFDGDLAEYMFDAGGTVGNA